MIHEKSQWSYWRSGKCHYRSKCYKFTRQNTYVRFWSRLLYLMWIDKTRTCIGLHVNTCIGSKVKKRSKCPFSVLVTGRPPFCNLSPKEPQFCQWRLCFPKDPMVCLIVLVRHFHIQVSHLSLRNHENRLAWRCYFMGNKSFLRVILIIIVIIILICRQ